MSLEMKESELQRTILEYLRLKKFLVFKHRNVGIFRKDTGKYIPLPEVERGIADIIGCTKEGQFLACEVKIKGNKATPAQLEFLKDVERHGGIAVLAFSLDDIMCKV